MGNRVKAVEREAILSKHKLGERGIAEPPRHFKCRAVGSRQRPTGRAADEPAGGEQDDAPTPADRFHDLTERALDAVSKTGPALESHLSGGKRLPMQEQPFEHPLEGPQAV